LKKRSLVICALAALVTAGVLAGCGNNYYFAVAFLPPSGIANRVLIAVQNPSAFSWAHLQFVDAYYDIRQSYNDKIPYFSISGYSGALPSTIQNMPEEQVGAVYGSGDGSFTLINYAKETDDWGCSHSQRPFLQRLCLPQPALCHRSQPTGPRLDGCRQAGGKQYSLGLPGVYHVSINPGGTVMLAFVQNSNYAYYPRKLHLSESTALAAYYLQNRVWPQPT
jgi:hypothetical protein